MSENNIQVAIGGTYIFHTLPDTGTNICLKAFINDITKYSVSYTNCDTGEQHRSLLCTFVNMYVPIEEIQTGGL